MKTKFSIIVPVYNSLGDLKKLIDSVIPQLNGHELIVVNDGSSNRTLRPWLDGNDHIRAIHLDRNQGSGAARNAGIVAARGERVLFIDADCVAHSDWLKEHEAFHRKFPHEVCLGNILPQSRESLLLRFLEYGSSPMFDLNNPQIRALELTSFDFFFTANASVPRQALVDSGLFDVRYNGAWDDIELAYRLHQHGLLFRFHKKATVSHRHPDTYTRFLRRQIRVGRGYWRLHNHHPELLDALSFANQWQALREGLKLARRQGQSAWESNGFMAIEFLGKLYFWYGYLREKRQST